LRSIGVGVASGTTPVTVLDVRSGLEDPLVLVPADGQEGVPLSFAGGAELSGPVNKQNAGFPISVIFPEKTRIENIQPTLTGAAEVTFDIIPPDPARRNAIGFIPHRPLSALTTYQVQVKADVNGKPWSRSWKFTTGEDLDASGILARRALERVNDYRKKAGLSPVELDAALSEGCRNHARYLVLNLDRPETQGLGAHDEDTGLPGYTITGRKAGRGGNIAFNQFEPVAAIDDWMATLYHRVPILDPRLQRIGFSCARGPRLGWISVLDVGSNRSGEAMRGPMCYPVDGQKDVPLAFPSGGEVPDPIPQDKDGRAGYPITATFPADQAPTAVKGSLKDDRDRDIAVWFSSPDKPANTKYATHQGQTVCLIPQDPLLPNSVYNVRLEGELEGRAWSRSWSFRTGEKGEDSVAAGAEMRERLNEYRRLAGLAGVELDPDTSRGCEAHARYLVLNAGRLGAKDFIPNDEDANLPGFTTEGKTAAQRTDIFIHAPTPLVQLEMLVAGVQRRPYLFDPNLRSIGYGASIEVGKGWIGVLDFQTGLVKDAPVLYPARNQEDVPITGLDTIAGSGGGAAGFPITVAFPAEASVADFRAWITDATGTRTRLETSLLPGTKAICAVPRRPLDRQVRYEVEATALVNGQSWSDKLNFTTRK
jgi:uncharacterized protein YkwD